MNTQFTHKEEMVLSLIKGHAMVTKMAMRFSLCWEKRVLNGVLQSLIKKSAIVQGPIYGNYKINTL